MPNEVAISVKNLDKFFKIYSHPREMIAEFFTRRKRHSVFHALKNVSFEISRGQTVGLIGLNGAGKSTLLKIIANTLDKTSGQVEVNGRVAAILELGSGFKPEYTGRQNIYMGGMCLGMSRQEINQKLDSIIEFSELQDFIDQPFKTYSTGMQARLTFATAISVSPDILIIDEALSVGDAKFQIKCFERIKQMQRSGVTILFVSHDINAVCSLCDRAFLLEGGRIVVDDEPGRVSDRYLVMLCAVDKNEQTESQLDDRIIIEKLSILNKNDQQTTSLKCGESFKVSIRLTFNIDAHDIAAGIIILNRFGVQLFGTTNHLCKTPIEDKCAQDRAEISINLRGNLYRGDYSLLARVLVKDKNGNEISVTRKILLKISGDSTQFDSSTIFLNPVFVQNRVIDATRSS